MTNEPEKPDFQALVKVYDKNFGSKEDINAGEVIQPNTAIFAHLQDIARHHTKLQNEALAAKGDGESVES